MKVTILDFITKGFANEVGGIEFTGLIARRPDGTPKVPIGRCLRNSGIRCMPAAGKIEGGLTDAKLAAMAPTIQKELAAGKIAGEAGNYRWFEGFDED